MTGPGECWIQVEMLAKHVSPAELKPGDRIWYMLQRELTLKHLILPNAYGPFVVVSAEPFRLRNAGGVELSLDPAILHLLVPTTDPPAVR